MANENWGRVHDIVPILRRKCRRRAFGPFAWWAIRQLWQPESGAKATKVANQIIVALTIEAIGEALLYAAKAGADPAKVRQALMGEFESSRILEVHGERMVKRAFDPGFRIEFHQRM